MSDILLVVFRLRDWPGKFTWVELKNSEPSGLAPHPGPYSELEMRQFLAERGCTAPEIEMQMQRAQETPEFNAPPFIVETFHKG
jgi:hypothetical protein